MNLRELEYLTALAETNHFGKAAKACHVSQSTLSIQIKKLEKELGIELVERNPRQVRLTAAGEQIVIRARNALAETDAIRKIAQQMKNPETASLRVGIFPTLAPYLLPHVMPVIQANYPKLELLLIEEKSDSILQQLLDGKLDAGILALPVESTELEEYFLFEEEFVLAVPTSHLIAETKHAITMADLTEQDILLLEDGHCLRDQALELCQLAGIDERQDFRSTSLETLRQMVASGVGITLLPRLSVSPPVPISTQIKLLEFKKPAPSRKIALFWRTSSAYRTFFPTFGETIKNLPQRLLSTRP